MRLHFVPIHVFRETPSVTFFDAGVPGSNGTDVVCHNGSATSPPDRESSEQYYVHQHQVDHNLVIEGTRIFTLFKSFLETASSYCASCTINGCTSDPDWNLSSIGVWR